MHTSRRVPELRSPFAASPSVRALLGASCRALPLFMLLSVCVLAQTVTTIHDFGSANDGQNPQSGVVFDRNGNIIGTAALGGSNSSGAAYMLTPNGGQWTETILHQFTGRPDGDTPDSLLTMTPDGRLFGTTQLGGSKNLGSIFVLIPPAVTGDPWRERVLYSFGSVANDGTGPNMSLIKVNSSLFGVTVDGGANRRGTIFQLTPPAGSSRSWIETILYSFASKPDGGFPSSDLVMDKNGNFYGSTLAGGTNDVGTVYRLSPPSASGGAWVETVIHSFTGADGSSPFGHNVVDKTGALLGTT